MRPAMTVFCDFDGTVTSRDALGEVLSSLADAGWAVFESEWKHGSIGSRDCLAGQIPLIRGGWPAIERVLNTVPVDPTFAGFAAWCEARGIPLVIVSDGFGLMIDSILAREHIRVSAVWANQLVIGEGGALSVSFPYPPRDRACAAGLCKCQVLRETTSKRVVIGDGLSDLCWASRADLCFAKGELLALCREQQITHREFKDFSGIQHSLAALLAEDGRPSTAPLLTR